MDQSELKRKKRWPIASVHLKQYLQLDQVHHLVCTWPMEPQYLIQSPFLQPTLSMPNQLLQVFFLLFHTRSQSIQMRVKVEKQCYEPECCKWYLTVFFSSFCICQVQTPHMNRTFGHHVTWPTWYLPEIGLWDRPEIQTGPHSSSSQQYSGWTSALPPLPQEKQSECQWVPII